MSLSWVNTFFSSSGKKAQGPHRQKTNYAASRQVPKLPPIKPLQVSKSRIQSANLSCIRELKSQVWDLQQQLSEARTENKLLKRLQHRHTVALQHFQDSEGSLSQVGLNHCHKNMASAEYSSLKARMLISVWAMHSTSDLIYYSNFKSCSLAHLSRKKICITSQH